jgi:trk system potassium uptake protein TrkA
VLFQKTLRETIIIVGCGRLGSSLADMLSQQNKNVTIIDMKGDAFRKIPLSYGGLSIEGDGSDLDILRVAGATETDLLLATTDDDDTNIMIAQIAKQILKIPRVIVRINDTSKMAAYADAGIESICPAALSMKEFRRIAGEEEDGVI